MALLFLPDEPTWLRHFWLGPPGPQAHGRVGVATHVGGQPRRNPLRPQSRGVDLLGSLPEIRGMPVRLRPW